MKKYFVFMLSFGIGACSLNAPYVDSYSGVANGASLRRSTSDRVAICFDEAPLDVLQAMANEECAKTSRKAVYDTTTRFSCSLTTPSTAYFDCK